MQWKCVINEIDSILKETETLKTLSHQFFSPGSVSRLKNRVDTSNDIKGLTQQVNDSVMYKIEKKETRIGIQEKKTRSRQRKGKGN